MCWALWSISTQISCQKYQKVFAFISVFWSLQVVWTEWELLKTAYFFNAEWCFYQLLEEAQALPQHTLLALSPYLPMTGEEAQKVSPHNVPLLLEDYLELMAIKNLQVEDKPLSLSKLPRYVYTGGLPQVRVITRDNFYLSGKHLITQHLFFL